MQQTRQFFTAQQPIPAGLSPEKMRWPDCSPRAVPNSHLSAHSDRTRDPCKRNPSGQIRSRPRFEGTLPLRILLQLLWPQVRADNQQHAVAHTPHPCRGADGTGAIESSQKPRHIPRARQATRFCNPFTAPAAKRSALMLRPFRHALTS